jgi:hypothetical protein
MKQRLLRFRQKKVAKFNAALATAGEAGNYICYIVYTL